MTLLDKYTFYKTVDFMITFSEKMVKAKIAPVPREMPKELKVKLEEMGKAFGLDMEGLTGKDAVMKVVNAVRELAIRLNIPQHISEVGGKEEDIPMLAQKALEDPCTGGNPRETSLEQFEELFKIAF